MDDGLLNHVRHLHEVEGLSIRQIADLLGLSRKKVTRLIEHGGIVKKKRVSIMDPYVIMEEQPNLRSPYMLATTDERWTHPATISGPT